MMSKIIEKARLREKQTVLPKAGGGQSSATPITHAFTHVKVSGSAHDSLILPLANGTFNGATYTILNQSGVVVDIYPQPGEHFKDKAVNVPFELPTDSQVTFDACDTSYWFVDTSSFINTGGDVSLAPVGSSPNANAATLNIQVLNLEPANATFPGVVTAIAQVFGGAKRFQDATVFGNAATPTMVTAPTTNRVGINTASPAFTLDVNGPVRSQTTGFILPDAKTLGGVSNANGLALTGGTLAVTLASTLQSGTITSANFIKLTSLQPIYTIGTGLDLAGTTLNNTSMLSSLSIDTFNIAGAQANALYFDGTNRLSISAASDSTPGAISLSNQTMGLGVKTFKVSGNNTVLATLSTNETRILNSGNESAAAPVLKLISYKSSVGQFYSTRLGNAVVEGQTDLTLKANATDSLSVDGSGFVTVLGGTGGVPGINMGTSNIQYVSGTPSSLQFNSDGYIDYTADMYASGFGSHRWNTGGGAIMQLSGTFLAPFTAAGISLGASALPWGQAWFKVSGTNATLGTASTNQITLRNDSPSAQMWLKFNYAGSDMAGVRSDSFGSFVADSVSDFFVLRSGVTKLQISSSTLTVGTASATPATNLGSALGTTSLRWGQSYFGALDVTNTNANGLTVNSNPVFAMTTANSDRIDTAQTTTSNTYTDLATVGPTVTILTGTAVEVTVCAYIASSTTSNTGYMGFAVSGATSRAAADVDSCKLSSGVPGIGATVSRTFKITGLTAGNNTFTAKYRRDGGSGTWTFSVRSLTVRRLN